MGHSVFEDMLYFEIFNNAVAFCYRLWQLLTEAFPTF